MDTVLPYKVRPAGKATLYEFSWVRWVLKAAISIYAIH